MHTIDASSERSGVRQFNVIAFKNIIQMHQETSFSVTWAGYMGRDGRDQPCRSRRVVIVIVI